MTVSQRKIGTDVVRAQFGFIAMQPDKLSECLLMQTLSSVFRVEKGRVNERLITTFVAFVEAAHGSSLTQSKAARRSDLPVEGMINWLTHADVSGVLQKKKIHASAAYRKAGQKSMHPPRFLTEHTLVVVIGSRRFLMDNLDLYLEQEGILRPHTFELLKDVADLEYARRNKRDDDYLHIDIANRHWYRGNVEALGQLVDSKRELARLIE